MQRTCKLLAYSYCGLLYSFRDASDEELYCLIDLEEVSVNARSPDVATKLQAITEARKLFSVDDCPEADELINSGLLAILVECLQSNK